MSAHSGDATTLDFHPTKPNIIATGGSSDRSVKVWDLESDLMFGQKDDGFVAVNYNTATSRTESASICTNDSSTGNDSYK
jgi:WD40 repeat protein